MEDCDVDADVDVRDPDEKSIMTYVAQFLQYSRDVPVPEEEMQKQYLTPPKSPSPINLPLHYTPAISASPLRQATPDRKAQEVTSWLVQAYDELLDGWDSTEGESYSERFNVIQTFLVSFNEQRRPIMPLLTAMKRTAKLSEEQRALREAWDTLTEKLREYKIKLDMSLPAPLDTVVRWLLRTEGVLAEEEGDPQNHSQAADEAREKQELLKVCLAEMSQQMKTYQAFQNLDEYGNMLVPSDKMDELKRRFTSVRVTAKYHGIKLEYREHRHTVLDLLGQIRTKVRVWKRPYISPEAVRVLLQEWHELVNTQELPSLLEAALHRLKQDSEKYSSKSALAADYHHVSQQVKQLQEDTAGILEEVTVAKSTMGRVLSAWDSYSDCLSSMQAWMEQGSATHSQGNRPEASFHVLMKVTPESLGEWGSRQAQLNEIGNFLIKSTDPQTSRSLSEELRSLNMQWAEFVKRNTFDRMDEPSADAQARPQDLQALIREATLVLKEPLETMSVPLRTYRKRIQFIMRKIKEVDLEALAPSPECPADQLQKIKLATPEVMHTLCEAEQVCAELQHSVSGLDSRLAELLHWEREARELYELLKAAARQQQGQDPRARVLISRGLQLEGQVVTEEQDLQAMVMTSQKTSPIQYLHSSAMQDREAVGMLSSIGARRDRSRSPPERPPSKVFIQAKDKPQHLTQPDTSQPTQKPETSVVSRQYHETFVPKIVVQEYREEEKTSPPLTYAQAVMQTRTKSPPQGQAQAWTATTAQSKHQQEQLPQQEQLDTQMDKEVNKQGPKQKQLQQQQKQERVEKQQVEKHQNQAQQHVVTHIQGETQVKQKPETHKQTSSQQTAKIPPSSQELQSRKAQAIKNRPWLQKPGSGEHKTPAPNPDQGPTHEPVQTTQPHVKTNNQPQKQQKKQQKQTQKHKNLEQQQKQQQQKQQEQQKKLPPIVKQEQPDSDTKAKSQTATMATPQSQSKAQNQSQPQTMVQSKSQAVVQVQVQSTSVSSTTTNNQQPLKTMSQTRVSHDQSQTVLPQPHGPGNTQSTNTSTQKQPQLQLQPQGSVQPQTCIPAGSQLSTQSQGLAHGQSVAQVQTWAQVRPSSPMQGQIQPPVPSHIQLRSHPQSWAPVRPPSPKPPTQTQTHAHSIAMTQTHAQAMVDPQTHAQSILHSQTQPQSMAQVQTHPMSVVQLHAYPQPNTQAQIHAQSMSQAQTHVQRMPQPHTNVQQMTQPLMHTQPMAQPSHIQPSQHQTQTQPVVLPQGHSHPITQYHTHHQTAVQQPAVQHPAHVSQGQLQTWTQVRTPSPVSIQHPQATAQPQIYPQGYSQAQSPSQQWIPKQEPQNRAIAQQRHPVPQTYTQQIGQAQGYPTVQAVPQWAQAGPQQGPQMGPPRYSHMGPSHTQPQMQPQTQVWAQTQTHMKPQSPMQQQPQVSAYNMVPIQSQQGQVQQQTWMQAPPHLLPQPYPQPQQYSQGQHQSQTQHHPQLHIQAPQSQPPHQPQLPEQLQLQPQLQAQSQTHIQTQPSAQSNLQAQTQQPPALAQAPPQAYTEAYAKAQALARNGFEEAKHCLQEHILEAVNVFKDKRISAEQTSVKEETLRILDPELLEEFLRAAKGMEAFCTPSQLSDMEFFTNSVRSQWEACFSADGSLAQAEQHLEDLKELCNTLSPEDAHRLAQTQLRECEKRLAAIQRQFSGEQDTSLPDSRIPVAFSEDVIAQEEPTGQSDKPQVSAEVSQVTAKTVTVETKEVEKQASVEEEVNKKEALERYENCKRTLQTQLAKNEQSIKDVPSDSVTLKGLHTRLQEIQFLRQETESLWSEYANHCSECSQLSGNNGLEQEKVELKEQWRSQQSSLQRRGSSLGAALRQIDSTENHMVDFTDRLDRFLRQPKDITAFTLSNTNILKDIKELDDSIQSELDQLSRLDPESSNLDPRDCFPLSREVGTHRTSLDQLRQQVRKSEAAARALDRFLMSLRTVDEDISGVQAAPCSDAVVLQECRSKLGLIRQSIDSLKDKAPQLDLLLQGARLTVTRDGVPASCLDMVSSLLRKLEEADSGLASQQQSLKKDTHSKSLGLRKKMLLGELKKLQDTIETQGLKEPTMPAVQQRLRVLSDLEGQLQAQNSELQSLRELQEGQGGGENPLEEVETQYEETQTALTDRRQQCSILVELLKKFQSCRTHLSNTMQRAEQTISYQASYMGKGNLQRSITKVHDIKEELGGLGEPMEEMRGICRQLQSQLKKFPDCSETPFEAEADTLMDSWLDVTEKTDAYMDNLRVGLELWEKQLIVGGEVDNWAGAKLALFSESHPFNNEQQVLAMRDEIHANEEIIEHFHKKSVEIQQMLQTQEAPLELQVMETQLKKRMEQVKELFTDCTDVFEELIAVKKHLAEKVEECQSAVENIQCSLSKVVASEPTVETQIQDLCDDLEAQEEQAEAVLKEVSLVSSVASPEVLEALSDNCSRLKEAISHTKDMIHLKREEKDKGLLMGIKDERQSFEGWFQDLQLSVNECFENPESKTDVETSLERLTDAETRLDQLKGHLERGSQQIPPQQLSELTDWLKEQQEEIATFRAHCHNRLAQMESLLSDWNSLQKQHDSFCDWLQSKEKQSVESDEVKHLLKDLQDESQRAETLSDLLAKVRRQGIRNDGLLKDGDNLIQRYRNLVARRTLEREYNMFNTQVESTRTWFKDILQPLTCPGRDSQTEEMKQTAEAILSSKPEGDTKVNNLRRQSQSLCEREDLKESRKQEIQQSVRHTEDQWRTVLQTAEDAFNKAETQALLDKDLDAFKTQNESVQSWIKGQDQNLQSLGRHMQVEEKLQIVQATLSSKHDGKSKLQDLKRRCKSLCDNQFLDECWRQEVQEAVRHTEQQWRTVLKTAEESLNKAEAEATAEREFVAFRSQSESIQSWIREQRLLSLSHVPFEDRLQIVQADMTFKLEGESMVFELTKQGERLCKLLEESRKPEVEQLVKDTKQLWKTVLQEAKQAELQSLSDGFDIQSKNTQSWIRDHQQQLQSVGSQTPPEERFHTAEVCLNSLVL
ncbi:hypothetical protein PAMP_006150 [Pampus punctatissimus]